MKGAGTYLWPHYSCCFSSAMNALSARFLKDMGPLILSSTFHTSRHSNNSVHLMFFFNLWNERLEKKPKSFLQAGRQCVELLQPQPVIYVKDVCEIGYCGLVWDGSSITHSRPAQGLWGLKGGGGWRCWWHVVPKRHVAAGGPSLPEDPLLMSSTVPLLLTEIKLLRSHS